MLELVFNHFHLCHGKPAMYVVCSHLTLTVLSSLPCLMMVTLYVPTLSRTAAEAGTKEGRYGRGQTGEGERIVQGKGNWD